MGRSSTAPACSRQRRCRCVMRTVSGSAPRPCSSRGRRRSTTRTQPSRRRTSGPRTRRSSPAFSDRSFSASASLGLQVRASRAFLRTSRSLRNSELQARPAPSRRLCGGSMRRQGSRTSLLTPSGGRSAELRGSAAGSSAVLERRRAQNPPHGAVVVVSLVVGVVSLIVGGGGGAMIAVVPPVGVVDGSVVAVFDDLVVAVDELVDDVRAVDARVVDVEGEVF